MISLDVIPFNDPRPMRVEAPVRPLDRQVELAHLRRLRRDLSNAAAHDGFVLHYQPRVTLETDGGRMTAAEALIRWPHRKRGLMPPGAFLPLAEQTGLMRDIGAWVLRAACTAASCWAGACNVAVNISARQLQDNELLAPLADALEVSGLEPEMLELEITESILVDDQLDTLLALSAIRDLGVGLTLDDFGTGHASLAMLRRLPLTQLKLDRSLVRGVPTDHEDAAIVRATIGAAHALGLGVIAEGVETEAQRDFLIECGCDEAQGYLFSQPLVGEEMSRRAASHRQVGLRGAGGSAHGAV